MYPYEREPAEGMRDRLMVAGARLVETVEVAGYYVVMGAVVAGSFAANHIRSRFATQPDLGHTAIRPSMPDVTYAAVSPLPPEADQSFPEPRD